VWKVGFVNACRIAGAPSGRAATAPASAAVVAALAAFHRALAQGESSAALALLAADVMIVEAGTVETREQYRAHHLPADIAYARAVATDRRVVSVTVVGDVAWVVSTSTAQGTFNGRPVNSTGAELAILTRAAGNADRWLLRAVHWSSR